MNTQVLLSCKDCVLLGFPDTAAALQVVYIHAAAVVGIDLGTTNSAVAVSVAVRQCNVDLSRV